MSMDKQNNLFSIAQAAEFLGVSIDTLRRWDKSGKLVATHKNDGTHRFYVQRDLELFASDLFTLATEWALSGGDFSKDLYCPNSAVFQARLTRMQDDFFRAGIDDETVALTVSIAGEIGNNSFDHNLGNWTDVPGVFFGHQVDKKIIILADRGLGILGTLKRVRPELATHEAALRVAFTEIVSGRAPEARGNGLKFVRNVITTHPMTLFFQTGNAEVRISNGIHDLPITKSSTTIPGCLTKITF